MDSALLTLDYSAMLGGNAGILYGITEKIQQAGYYIGANNCISLTDYTRQLDYLIKDFEAVFVLGVTDEFREAVGAKDTEIIVYYNDKPVIMLPFGKNAEIILETFVFPVLKPKKKTTSLINTFHAFGITAQTARETLKDLLKAKKKFSISFIDNVMECEVVVRYPNNSAPIDVEFTLNEIRRKLKQYIYSEGDISLEMTVIELLQAKSKSLAIAESYTGGGLCAKLIAVPGASRVIKAGIVAYSDAAKEKLLGISKEMLEKKSPVSFETAYEMAAGILNETAADCVIATTGFAGPTGDKVGQCFLAIGDEKHIHLSSFNFEGSRSFVTECGIKAALNQLLLYLRNV